MANTWKNIWNNKKLQGCIDELNEYETFCILKKTDGFDVNVEDEKSYFDGFYNDFIDMFDTIGTLAGKYNSVYEVGCGSGVNLYMFKNRIQDVILGGIDYSDSLVDIAGDVIGESDLRCGGADEIDENEKYDIVISDSVFQYFPSVEYAENVLEKMCKKADKLVFLGELHDKRFEKEWLDNRRKAIENYDELYKNLGRTFVTHEWVEQIAAKYDRKVKFTSKENGAYWSSKYIFNAYIY